MRVNVNGAVRDVTDATTVGDLIGEGARGVAVALNAEVVPRSRWSDTVLREGDRVEILEPQQGG